jgi:hypothetical protein
MWGGLLTCAPIDNRREKSAVDNRAQDDILPHSRTELASQKVGARAYRSHRSVRERWSGENWPAAARI